MPYIQHLKMFALFLHHWSVLSHSRNDNGDVFLGASAYPFASIAEEFDIFRSVVTSVSGEPHPRLNFKINSLQGR